MTTEARLRHLAECHRIDGAGGAANACERGAEAIAELARLQVLITEAFAIIGDHLPAYELWLDEARAALSGERKGE
jgi:hypothetical protein